MKARVISQFVLHAKNIHGPITRPKQRCSMTFIVMAVSLERCFLQRASKCLRLQLQSKFLDAAQRRWTLN
jgi:hypothetical protein